MHGNAVRWERPVVFGLWVGLWAGLAALLAACGAPAGAGLEKGGGHDGGTACIVADGEGGARVASHCPATHAFFVGGTVSGADGPLVLENLGIDTLPVTEDGSFTFTVALADGAPYAVTVTSPSSRFGRVCAVTRGTGVIDGADVTGVAVVCTEAPADDEVVDPPAPPEEVVDDPPAADDEVVETPEEATPGPVAEEPAEEQPAEEEAVDEEAVDEGPAPEPAVEAPGADPVVSSTPDGPRWNAYVRADTGAPCDGTEPGPWGTCRHAGEMRDVAVLGRAACEGLTAVDDLGAFDWRCEVRDGAAHMVTRALRAGVRLSDLVDFAAVAWRDNALHVFAAGAEIQSTEPGPWWTNPVASLGDGDLDVPGGIYLVAADATARARLLADGVALVVAPGATLRGPGDEAPVVAARDLAFLWIEGRIDAAGSGEGVRADLVRLSVLDGVKVQGAAHAGIHLLNVRACRVTDAVVVQNDTYGLLLEGEGNLVRGLLAAGNALSGLHVIGGSDNRMAGVTAAGNGNWGVVLRASTGNVLAEVTTANHVAYGVWLDRAPGTTLMDVAALDNGTAGLYLFESPGALLANVAATDNGFGGLILHDSSYNHLTGRVLVGGNPWNCMESGGTAPGVESVTCAGTDGSDPQVTTGVSLAAAFAGKLAGDEPMNPDDVDGAAPYDAIADWTSFGPFRHWGREAETFPGVAAWGRCTDGTCRVWDWALKPDDTLARGALAAPDGTAALTHAWDDGTVSVFLPNAVEVIGDGAGDEDLLCEAGETCRHTPDLASDPGPDAVLPLDVPGDAVPGVTLLGAADG